jgi:hypothetical protein
MVSLGYGSGRRTSGRRDLAIEDGICPIYGYM